MQCNANALHLQIHSQNMILTVIFELEGDLSQCSSLVEESEEDALSYSPIKVLALTFQGYIGRTYLATDALHCFYFVELPLA